MDFPLDDGTISKVECVTGGLPLAIQWLIGRFKRSGNISEELECVLSPDSPVLEFSFRNVWHNLSTDSRAVLAIMSIFESRPPTIDLLSVTLGWARDRIERALDELIDVTLVSKSTQEPIGIVIYTALPITLSFAQYQLGEMGDFETKCRQRYQIYNDHLELKEFETQKFDNIFGEYGLQTESEKKAAILCKRAQSEFFGGNVELADELFKQAKEMAPNSSYIFAMSASNHLARNRLGLALKDATESCKKATKKTGSLCYTIKARVLKIQKDVTGVVEAFEKALGFDQSNVFIRHQYGVALSRAKHTEKAIQQFTIIIEQEKTRPIPQETLLIALKTRILNLKRLGKTSEANADIEYANELLTNYPHLKNLAWQFLEYEEIS